MAALVLVTLLSALPSIAAGVLISPPIVELSATRPFADLTVQNVGPAPREVVASVLGWSQDERGGVALAEIGGVAMFPRRAVLAAGEARRFRLSSEEDAPDRERAYRVALRVRDLASGGFVTALVPAFFAPARARTAAVVHVACAPGHCRVVVENGGTVRFRPEHGAVALVEDGGATSSRALDDWWVLAGGSRAYDVPFAPGSAVRQVIAQIDVAGEALTASALVAR